jgi:8-oxo-dGTP pyrophosphatase MutT (NUDIX family)
MIFKNKPNVSYEVKDEKGNKKTIWNSRSVAVNCVVVLVGDFDMMGPFVLASKRGPNAADFQGKWNLVSGYLDYNESGTEAVYREVWEECGINIPAIIKTHKVISNDLIQPWHVKTEPDENKQNVSLRYGVIIKYKTGETFPLSLEHNEVEGEVEEAIWMPIENIDKYEWAFNHDKVILEYINKIFY